MSDFRTKANRVYMIVRLVIFTGFVTYAMIAAPESWPIENQLCVGFWVLVTIGYIIKGKLPPVTRSRHY